MGLFSFLGCVNQFFNALAAPEDIAKFDIDLSREHSFTTQVDFKTHTGHVKGDDKSGFYKVAISDKSLKTEDMQSHPVWKKIFEREKETKATHTGKIIFEWEFSDGLKEQWVCEGNAGSFGAYNTVIVGGFWLPARSKQEVSDVKITIARVDTLLSQNLKVPKIWIYRGGGK